MLIYLIEITVKIWIKPESRVQVLNSVLSLPLQIFFLVCRPDEILTMDSKGIKGTEGNTPLSWNITNRVGTRAANPEFRSDPVSEKARIRFSDGLESDMGLV